VQVLLGAAVPWLITAKFVWSEPVFIFLFAAYAAAMYAYLQARRWGWLLAASVVGVLLPLQRTSGLFLLIGSGVGLLLAYPEWWRPRLHLWLAHVVGTSSGGVAWLVYARFAAEPEYYHNRGWQALHESLADFGFVFARWFVPVQQSGELKHWGFALLYLVMLAGLGYTTWRHGGRWQRWLLVTILFYLLAHVWTTVMSRSFANVYNAERYAAPVYAAFLLLAASAVQHWVERRRWVVWLMGLWLLYPVARAVRVAHFCHQMPVKPLPPASR
jgi:hypothetical protein